MFFQQGKKSSKSGRILAAPFQSKAAKDASEDHDVRSKNITPIVPEVDYRSFRFKPLEGYSDISFDNYCGPTAESNWVIPGVLLVGAYPASQDDVETFELLTSILKLGVRMFVCLQLEYKDQVSQEMWKAGMALRPYFHDVKKIVRNKHLIPEFSNCDIVDMDHLSFEHCPIVDCGITDDDRVLDLAKKLVVAISKGEVIYLHCWGGHGRTGTLVCVMLHLMYGLSAQEAMARCQVVHDLRHCPVDVGSPQTQTQRDQVTRIVNRLILDAKTTAAAAAAAVASQQRANHTHSHNHSHLQGQGHSSSNSSSSSSSGSVKHGAAAAFKSFHIDPRTSNNNADMAQRVDVSLTSQSVDPESARNAMYDRRLASMDAGRSSAGLFPHAESGESSLMGSADDMHPVQVLIGDDQMANLFEQSGGSTNRSLDSIESLDSPSAPRRMPAVRHAEYSGSNDMQFSSPMNVSTSPTEGTPISALTGAGSAGRTGAGGRNAHSSAGKSSHFEVVTPSGAESYGNPSTVSILSSLVTERSPPLASVGSSSAVAAAAAAAAKADSSRAPSGTTALCPTAVPRSSSGNESMQFLSSIGSNVVKPTKVPNSQKKATSNATSSGRVGGGTAGGIGVGGNISVSDSPSGSATSHQLHQISSISQQGELAKLTRSESASKVAALPSPNVKASAATNSRSSGSGTASAVGNSSSSKTYFSERRQKIAGRADDEHAEENSEAAHHSERSPEQEKFNALLRAVSGDDQQQQQQYSALDDERSDCGDGIIALRFHGDFADRSEAADASDQLNSDQMRRGNGGGVLGPSLSSVHTYMHSGLPKEDRLSAMNPGICKSADSSAGSGGGEALSSADNMNKSTKIRNTLAVARQALIESSEDWREQQTDADGAGGAGVASGAGTLAPSAGPSAASIVPTPPSGQPRRTSSYSNRRI